MRDHNNTQWYWVTAIGQDRPGIVAELARGVADACGNIEDASMSRFRSWFAAMLLVSGPEGFAQAAALPDDEELHTAIQSIGTHLPDSKPHQAIQRLSVYGGDRPGIVATVGDALQDAGANILSLDVDVVRDNVNAPLFVMSLDIETAAPLPESFAETLGNQIGLEVHLVDLDAPIL